MLLVFSDSLRFNFFLLQFNFPYIKCVISSLPNRVTLPTADLTHTHIHGTQCSHERMYSRLIHSLFLHCIEYVMRYGQNDERKQCRRKKRRKKKQRKKNSVVLDMSCLFTMLKWGPAMKNICWIIFIGIGYPASHTTQRQH